MKGVERGCRFTVVCFFSLIYTPLSKFSHLIIIVLLRWFIFQQRSRYILQCCCTGPRRICRRSIRHNWGSCPRCTFCNSPVRIPGCFRPPLCYRCHSYISLCIWVLTKTTIPWWSRGIIRIFTDTPTKILFGNRQHST